MFVKSIDIALQHFMTKSWYYYIIINIWMMIYITNIECRVQLDPIPAHSAGWLPMHPALTENNKKKKTNRDEIILENELFNFL